MRKGVESFASNNPPKGTPGPKPANPESGRQNNQGLEGLAIGPDGKHLYALLQSALIQDGGNGGSSPTRFNTRLLAYDISDPAAPKLTGEYVVQLPRFKDPKKGKTLVAAQSELLALNDKQFLVIARDSARGFATPEPASVYRSVDLISIAKATNIAGTDFDGTKPVAPEGELDPSVTPARISRLSSTSTTIPSSTASACTTASRRTPTTSTRNGRAWRCCRSATPRHPTIIS